MKERLMSARCPIHGSRRCEVFMSNLCHQKDRKRWRKKSRQIAKKQESGEDQ